MIFSFVIYYNFRILRQNFVSFQPIEKFVYEYQAASNSQMVILYSMKHLKFQPINITRHKNGNEGNSAKKVLITNLVRSRRLLYAISMPNN